MQSFPFIMYRPYNGRTTTMLGDNIWTWRLIGLQDLELLETLLVRFTRRAAGVLEHGFLDFIT
jgi:hypothetical protein